MTKGEIQAEGCATPPDQSPSSAFVVLERRWTDHRQFTEPAQLTAHLRWMPAAAGFRSVCRRDESGDLRMSCAKGIDRSWYRNGTGPIFIHPYPRRR